MLKTSKKIIQRRPDTAPVGPIVSPTYTDVMVDLETLGRRAGCVVLSIGAVAFDPCTNTLGLEFYEVISATSCEEHGLHTDPETLAWWEKQSPEARQVLEEARGPYGGNLPLVLREFNTYLKQFGSGKVRVWGNGSDFDNAILYAAYAAAGLPIGWQFWNSRCFRTLKNLAKEVEAPARVGTYHNALDDAKTQALHANLILRYLHDGT